MSRTLRQLAALAMIAAIGAGCSKAPATTSTANSANSSTPSTPTTAGTGTGTGGNSSGANVEKAVQFSQCMRANGVSAFPDPDASGSLTIDGVVNGSSVDPNSAAWKRAISACKNLEPAGFTGGMRSPQQMQAALQFAQCIRANGVTDFPDPINGQPLVDTNRIPSSATSSGMSILNAAMRKCRNFAAGAGVGGP